MTRLRGPERPVPATLDTLVGICILVLVATTPAAAWEPDDAHRASHPGWYGAGSAPARTGPSASDPGYGGLDWNQDQGATWNSGGYAGEYGGDYGSGYGSADARGYRFRGDDRRGPDRSEGGYPHPAYLQQETLDYRFREDARLNARPSAAAGDPRYRFRPLESGAESATGHFAPNADGSAWPGSAFPPWPR